MATDFRFVPSRLALFLYMSFPYTNVSVCTNSPFYHSAMSRNCSIFILFFRLPFQSPQSLTLLLEMLFFPLSKHYYRVLNQVWPSINVFIHCTKTLTYKPNEEKVRETTNKEITLTVTFEKFAVER